MKRLLVCLLLLALTLSMAACGNSNDSLDGNSKIVLRYGDITMDEAEFKYIASYVKDYIVYQQQNELYQYYGAVYSESDILAMQIDEDTTIGDYIKEYSVEFAQQLMIIEKICKDSNDEITDQADISEIENHLSELEYAYGGTDLFEIALVRMGFSRSGIERFQRFYTLYNMLYEARYGSNGTARVPAESVNAYFTENYMRYDGVMYSYLNSDGTKITFKYTDDEVKSYFDTEFVKVRHILYKTVDSSQKELSDEKKAEKKASAEAAYKAIINNEKTFDDYLSENEDSQSEYIFTYGKMVDSFEKASFEMQAGEVRLVETEYGYHIIQKLEKTETDFTGTVDENGKTTGSRKEEALAAMSAAKIRKEALETFGKLQNGELTDYPKTSDEVKYYVSMGNNFIDKNESTNKTLVELLTPVKAGEFIEKEYPADATYILRNLSFEEKDITSDIYSKIESKLAVEAYSEYVQSFYDNIEMNKEYIDSFDIITLPLLEEEFYID